MVTEWGMSEKLGMVAYGDNSQEVFLGHSITQSKNVSEATAQAIDAEVRAIIDAAYARAKKILTENRHELEALAKALLEYETLSGEEIKQVLRGEPIDRTRPDEPMTARGSVPTAGRPKPRPAGDAGMAPGPAPA
jgi:cell division protease FtsH